jgi:hypothetical protein
MLFILTPTSMDPTKLSLIHIEDLTVIVWDLINLPERRFELNLLVA